MEVYPWLTASRQGHISLQLIRYNEFKRWYVHFDEGSSGRFNRTCGVNLWMRDETLHSFAIYCEKRIYYHNGVLAGSFYGRIT